MVFAAVCLAVFFSFIKAEKCFVATVDGESQYILYLRYMGQYLRKTLSGFLHGDFRPDLFDFSIGIGDDIGAIVRFHPLDLLSVFVPAAYTEQLYDIILLLRFYLAGLAFSAYAFASHKFVGREESSEKKAAWENVISGSLVYIFCGYMLIRVTNHPTYAAPFVVLPLLLLGMERVLQKKGSLLFISSVLLGFWSNYYFMYICSIALLVYALLRYPEVVKERRAATFLPYAGKLTGLYLIGMLMSMTTLLPALLRYRSSYRTSQTQAMQNLLVYGDKRRYAAWFLNLISPYQSSGNGLDLNFAVIVLPALVLLFTGAYRKYRTLRISLFLELAALLIPFFGFVFAGMNNENNRWVFLISFALGMCCVRTIDGMNRMSRRQYAAVLLVSAVFLMAAGAENLLAKKNIYSLTGALELLILLAVISLFRKKKGNLKLFRCMVLLLTGISCAVSGYLTYSSRGGNLVRDYQDRGRSIARYQELDRQIASQIPDDSFYRVDSAGVNHGLENSAEYFGYNSIGMYNSILNTNLIKTLLDEGNVGLDAITQVHDLDGRVVSENLAHVKYYLVNPMNYGKVPYGYGNEPVLADDKMAVYENQNLLSEGFTSDRFITWNHYQKLSDIEKEMVKLDAVVLPEDGSVTQEQMKEAGLEEVVKPGCRISEEKLVLPETGDGLGKAEETTDGSGIVYRADKIGGLFTMSFAGKGGTYSFLRLNGVSGADDYENMGVSSPEGIDTRVVLRGSTNVHTIGRSDYLFNLGYNSQDRERSVQVMFAKKGLHKVGSAELVTVSMDGYEEKIAAMNEQSLSDARIEDGLIEGKIHTENARLAVFTAAMKDGWKMFVDGEEEKTLTLDGMYAGVFLKPGDHEIRLIYTTPGLKAGLFMTLAGIILTLALSIFERAKRGRR